MELVASKVAEQNEAETEPSKEPRRLNTKETAIELSEIAFQWQCLRKLTQILASLESKQRHYNAVTYLLKTRIAVREDVRR